MESLNWKTEIQGVLIHIWCNEHWCGCRFSQDGDILYERNVHTVDDLLFWQKPNVDRGDPAVVANLWGYVDIVLTSWGEAKQLHGV